MRQGRETLRKKTRRIHFILFIFPRTTRRRHSATWAPQRATTETKKVLYRRRNARGRADSAEENKPYLFYFRSGVMEAPLGDRQRHGDDGIRGHGRHKEEGEGQPPSLKSCSSDRNRGDPIIFQSFCYTRVTKRPSDRACRTNSLEPYHKYKRKAGNGDSAQFFIFLFFLQRATHTTAGDRQGKQHAAAYSVSRGVKKGKGSHHL